MADSENPQVKLDAPAADQPSASANQESVPAAPLSPQKRVRSQDEDAENQGSALKRVKGVAPIKAESVAWIRPTLSHAGTDLAGFSSIPMAARSSRRSVVLK